MVILQFTAASKYLVIELYLQITEYEAARIDVKLHLLCQIHEKLPNDNYFITGPRKSF